VPKLATTRKPFSVKGCSVQCGIRTANVESVEDRASQFWMGRLSLLHGSLLAIPTLGLFAFCLSAFCATSSACDFSALYLYREDPWLLLIQTFLLFAACSRLTDRDHRLRFLRWTLPFIAA